MSTKANPLVIDKVSVSYGAAPVIQDVSFSVKAGESFGLMGLNGAGKTTLIKAVLGLRQQDSGSIEVYQKPCTSADSKSRLAYLPERFEPPWFLTGFEFLKFSLALYKQEFDQNHVAEAAEKLALDSAVLKKRVQTYSKGMRQKLGLLGTVLTGCSLLILDEPMSGLDPQARTMVKDMLSEAQTKGRTIFLSSHILADMDEICDRVAVMHDGTIGFVGEPEELKKKTGAKNLERAFLHCIEKKRAA